MAITKDNYRDQVIYCWECNEDIAGTSLELVSSADGRLWELRCPGCNDELTAFLKEQPDFSSITPDKLESRHWALVQAMMDAALHTPEIFDGGSHRDISFPEYISAVAEPYNDILKNFHWMEWDEGKRLTEAPEELRKLDFATAIALLHTWYRAERFNDGLIEKLLKDGSMVKLLEAIQQAGSGL